VSGTMKSGNVITLDSDKQPATVELKVGQTFRTFYVESEDGNKDGDTTDSDSIEDN
jgi:hypothetical protein